MIIASEPITLSTDLNVILKIKGGKEICLVACKGLLTLTLLRTKYLHIECHVVDIERQ